MSRLSEVTPGNGYVEQCVLWGLEPAIGTVRLLTDVCQSDFDFQSLDVVQTLYMLEGQLEELKAKLVAMEMAVVAS